MNHLIIIGNLTRDPEARVTQTGINVCNFSVAVNRRGKKDGEAQGVDYFNVTAWRQLAGVCSTYLKKGRKVCVTGSVVLSTYERKDGGEGARMDVTADNVEFLSSRQDEPTGGRPSENSGFTMVQDEDLPF